MTKKMILMFTLSLVLIFSIQTVSAQITITIPKFPKIKKPKVETTSEPETNGSSQDSQNNTLTRQNEPEPKYEPMDARLSLFLDEITKAQKEVDAYTPEDKLYLVGTTSSEWMWRAVSPKERGEWAEKWKSLMTPAVQKKFEDKFTVLSASAAGKLPAYKSNISKFSVHNAAEEKMMKGVLTKIADYKIFSSGLKEASWLIDKDDYNLPTARYKHGVIYLRDTKSDHPYCYASFINIKQDYAGGGTYATSYATFIEDEMVGCPAGTK